MIDHSVIAKGVAVPVALFIGSEIVPPIVNAGAEAVVLAAAAIAAVVYLGRGLRKLIRGARALVARVHSGIDVIETVPGRLDSIETRLDQTDKRFEVIADAERHRVKDAVAGDQRSPVDRRSV